MVYNNVIDYCTKNNMSISAFEQKCGLPNGLVRKWREKNCEPSVPTLQKIATATNISLENWLKE